MPGVKGFERARSSRAGDKGTTTVEQYDWADGVWAGRPREDGLQADGPQADGPQERLSPGNRVWADQAMQLQMEEDLDDPLTDRVKSRGSAC